VFFAVFRSLPTTLIGKSNFQVEKGQRRARPSPNLSQTCLDLWRLFIIHFSSSFSPKNYELP